METATSKRPPARPEAASNKPSGSSTARLAASKTNTGASSGSNRNKQFPSIILFVSVIIIVNLCPFHSDLEQPFQQQQQQQPQSHETDATPSSSSGSWRQATANSRLSTTTTTTTTGHIEACLEFAKLMFTNPMRLGKRSTRFTLAEARMLGKMAKVWYIKKKIKKLSKKLKKHTIAVPVFTAIPIYEHSYYPQPHVTMHHGGGGMHHAAAASSYAPTVTAPASVSGAAASQAAATQQQLAVSASSSHQQMAAPAAYRLPPPSPAAYHHHAAAAMYHQHQMPAAAAHQIINSYAPSPPLYVDEAGGLYGHYGNAYGRYDGGYHLW